VPFFALKFIVKYPKVKHFTDSQLGWLYDPRELPYWTFDAPFLMRDTKWLQWWGGQRTRTLGSIHVSIVDVRPTDVYSQGHVPFALNIPPSVFRENLQNPEALAKILGPAGVNAAHEAVVISGTGLTKDSALAFLLLEKLGQKKISVFMDPMEKWANLRFPVKKDATVVAPQKVRHDLSIPPTDYPATLRKGVIITDPKSTSGLYPKVFIASGKDVPARAVDGKVIHIPYTELLNGDGTPKPAKDIWNILDKGGVPRYAELICISDDAGEAAANYFVLKLMGYPDIKILVF
jgi:thiosulfate/3-mercaptopyruvate sulfurtransferase